MPEGRRRRSSGLQGLIRLARQASLLWQGEPCHHKQLAGALFSARVTQGRCCDDQDRDATSSGVLAVPTRGEKLMYVSLNAPVTEGRR
jgi:hypothetical protein